MRRRALLASCASLSTVAVSGCLSETAAPATDSDGTTPDDGETGDGKTDEEETRDIEARCPDPAYEIREGEIPPRMDHVRWEIWGGVSEDGARMSRTVVSDSDSVTLSDGERIARAGDLETVRVDDELVFESPSNGEPTAYAVGDVVGYRWDEWELTSIDGRTAELEPRYQLDSLKIGWEAGDYLRIDGSVYMVDIEPQEAVLLCPLSETED